MLSVGSCCCGCSLNTGCIIIGSITLIGSLIGVVLVGIGLGESGSSFWEDGWNKYCTDNPDIDCAQYKQVALIILWVYLFLCIFNVIINSLLIHGCRKKIPSLLMPWLVVSCLSLAISIISAIAQAAQFGLTWNSLAAVLGWLLSAYFILVVKSYRTVMRRSDYF